VRRDIGSPFENWLSCHFSLSMARVIEPWRRIVSTIQT
jgi:hypothetical protein